MISEYVYAFSVDLSHKDIALFITLYGKFETATIKLLVVLRILNGCDLR